jgi:hypothetical protein
MKQLYSSHSTELLPHSKSFARKHKVDLAIPNCPGSGLGNVLVYTRLIEEYALSIGRPISIITAPIAPKVGIVDSEAPYPFFENNPFIKQIVNAEEIDPEGFKSVNAEEHAVIQLSHVIENICFAYGLRARELRPSLFLTCKEKEWALNALSHLPRPLVCLHPGGTSSSPGECPWNITNWKKLIQKLNGKASFFQIGRPDFVDQDLGLDNPGTTIREAMALIWASDFYIGFDSCPMHIATAFRKSIIALFHMENKFRLEKHYGEVYVPSVMLRWAYPNNTNLSIMPNDYEGERLLAKITDIVATHVTDLKQRV